MHAFLHPALVQTRDYSRSNYTCIHFLWGERDTERDRQRETDTTKLEKAKCSLLLLLLTDWLTGRKTPWYLLTYCYC